MDKQEIISSRDLGENIISANPLIPLFGSQNMDPHSTLILNTIYIFIYKKSFSHHLRGISGQVLVGSNLNNIRGLVALDLTVLRTLRGFYCEYYSILLAGQKEPEGYER
jgi:hypothetical protein